MNTFMKVMAVLGIITLGIILIPIVILLAIPFGWLLGLGLVVGFMLWLIGKATK